jgi:hypothetical protein
LFSVYYFIAPCPVYIAANGLAVCFVADLKADIVKLVQTELVVKNFNLAPSRQ